MSVGAYNIDRAFADQASELDTLDRTVSELRYNLDELSQDQDVLKRQISMLETDSIEPLSSSVADLEQATEEMQRDLAQTRTVVQHLAGRLAWLEHHVRTGSGLVAVAIDEASPALQELARRADLASTAGAGILSESQRGYQQAQISLHDDLGEQRQQYLAEAVTQSRVLANCPSSGDEHGAAATAFRAALSQADKLADQISSTSDRASNARARLAADDEFRRTHAATIATGEQAKVVLHRRLRQRIIDAVGDRVLFPSWFTTALGYSPPAEGTTEWIAAATELIAYRITYGVTDPAVALGDRPDADQAIRAAWFNTLTIRLRKQRQWP
jgi:chromosome segregation ATPase